MRGWPNSVNSLPSDIKSFYKHRLNLTTFNGCFTSGTYGGYSSELTVLKLLHDRHPGITCMKSLARLHVWWLTIDADTEQTV